MQKILYALVGKEVIVILPTARHRSLGCQDSLKPLWSSNILWITTLLLVWECSKRIIANPLTVNNDLLNNSYVSSNCDQKITPSQAKIFSSHLDNKIKIFTNIHMYTHTHTIKSDYKLIYTYLVIYRFHFYFTDFIFILNLN